MSGFNASALGDWIQIAASACVIGGFAFLIVEVARTQWVIDVGETEQSSGSPMETTLDTGVEQVLSSEHLAKISAARQSELRNFLKQNCPACHGPTGGIGPPLSDAHLQHLSVDALASTILHGRPAKGMPPWDSRLSPVEAQWIAAFLKAEDTSE
jgi:hypothetical protein